MSCKYLKKGYHLLRRIFHFSQKKEIITITFKINNLILPAYVLTYYSTFKTLESSKEK